MRLPSLLLLLLAACGARSGLTVDGDSGDAAVVDDADAEPPPETRVSCAPTLDAPLEIPSRGETRFVASHLGAVGARLVVLRGRDELELLALDFEARTTRPLASFSGSLERSEVSRVAFGADGTEVGLCGEDLATLRILDDGGGERTTPFPAGIEDCSSVGFGNGAWLVVAKEWATPAPATLLRFSSTLELTGRADLSAPMRSFVGGGPQLFERGDGYVFVYRTFERESWPDEALHVQRLSGGFDPYPGTRELIADSIINGETWTVTDGFRIYLLFKPHSSALVTGDSPHFRAYAGTGFPTDVPVPLLPTGRHGLNFTLHSTGEGFYWAWIDPGADFEPGVPTSGSTRRLLLQPLSDTGDRLAPPTVLHERPGETAIRPVIQSRIDGDRQELLVAWQGAGVGGGLGNVYATLVTCARL